MRGFSSRLPSESNSSAAKSSVLWTLWSSTADERCSFHTQEGKQLRSESLAGVGAASALEGNVWPAKSKNRTAVKGTSHLGSPVSALSTLVRLGPPTHGHLCMVCILEGNPSLHNLEQVVGFRPRPHSYGEVLKAFQRWERCL